MINEYAIYDISNKVLKFGLSLYEWFAVIGTTMTGLLIFHKNIFDLAYNMLFLGLLVISLKVYKINKPDGYMKSVIGYFFSNKTYHVHYKTEKKYDNIAYKL